MEDDITITVDKRFLSMAITYLLQSDGQIADQVSMTVKDWVIDTDNDYLVLLCDRKEETVN